MMMMMRTGTSRLTGLIAYFDNYDDNNEDDDDDNDGDDDDDWHEQADRADSRFAVMTWHPFQVQPTS